MDIESVTSGCPLRPAGAGERIAAHHQAEALEECAREPGLNRRERHPGVAVAKDPVRIDVRHASFMTGRPAREGVESESHVEVGCGKADPVLQAVTVRRRSRSIFDK